jgi:hypothetical protein
MQGVFGAFPGTFLICLREGLSFTAKYADGNAAPACCSSRIKKIPAILFALRTELAPTICSTNTSATSGQLSSRYRLRLRKATTSGRVCLAQHISPASAHPRVSTMFLASDVVCRVGKSVSRPSRSGTRRTLTP